MHQYYVTAIAFIHHIVAGGYILFQFYKTSGVEIHQQISYATQKDKQTHVFSPLYS